MTGSEATFGQSTDNGIQLAVEEINEAGGVNGKKIRVITYDDKGDAREAGTAVTRLVTRDQVVAVLGEVASSLSLVGAPVCQENGVPMVTPSSTNPEVTEVGDMIFRVCFIDPFQGIGVRQVRARARRPEGHEGGHSVRPGVAPTPSACRKNSTRRSTSSAARSLPSRPTRRAIRISPRS